MAQAGPGQVASCGGGESFRRGDVKEQSSVWCLQAGRIDRVLRMDDPVSFQRRPTL